VANPGLLDNGKHSTIYDHKSSQDVLWADLLWEPSPPSSSLNSNLILVWGFVFLGGFPLFPMCFADVSAPALSLCWASWLVTYMGCEIKACTFPMNTAILTPFRVFIWTKQRTKVSPAAIVISIFYKLIQAPEHLQDD